MFVDRDGTGCRITFEEISARTAQWTSLLRRRGVAQGDRVLVLVGKTPEWHPIMLAAVRRQ